jgi:hypothetical protein
MMIDDAVTRLAARAVSIRLVARHRLILRMLIQWQY